MDLSGFKTENTTDMSDMFTRCESLMQLDLSGFDTSHVFNMDGMFSNCTSLTQLDVSGFDTSKVKDMTCMFNRCESLTQLDVSGFDTSHVTYMGGMFQGCTLLKVLDLSFVDNDWEMNLNDESLESLTTLITPSASFRITLNSEQGKCWLDGNNNYYDADKELVFEKSTILYHFSEEYKISHIYTGSLKDCPTSYNVKEGLSELGSVEHSCGTFMGWYLEPEYKTKVDVIKKGNVGDITLYAKMDIVYDYDKENGTVITKVTLTEDGEIQYKCKKCDSTISEIVPKSEYQALVTEQGISSDTLAITDKVILETKSETDLKGSSFSKIQAKAQKVTKKSVKLTWKKVSGADGYLIYGNKCGKKNRYKLITTISNGKTTSFTHKQLKKGTYYKYIVRAYKDFGGERISVAVSKTIHASTAGGKYGNAKSVKIKTDGKLKQNKKKEYTLKLKKNKKYIIKASEVKQSKKIKKHRKIAFESSNKKIATVSKKGVVKAKKKGTCYIYAYAQNGIFKKIKVTVK